MLKDQLCQCRSCVQEPTDFVKDGTEESLWRDTPCELKLLVVTQSYSSRVWGNSGRELAVDRQIGALWMEGPLSYLEELCLVSFRDAGHQTILYSYGDVPNVPDGIEQRDASDVLPAEGHLSHARTGSPALHSDVFRYHLLAQNDGMIWADTDAYCHQPFQTDTGFFFGWESEKHVNGGVLGLPANSKTLKALLEFTSDEFAVPTWYGDAYTAELHEARDNGKPVHAGEQPWGVWGPHALTHFLSETGEIEHALPRHALYPFSFKDRRKMLQRGVDLDSYLKPDTFSVHFYGRRMRKRLVEKEGGVPRRYSLIGKLLHKHKVDPLKNPLPGPSSSDAVAKRGSNTKPAYHRAIDPASGNLTDLADRFGSDKGSSKHRYTELYHLLFAPRRHQELTLMEMGLLIGGPEHGADADRATSDLPSIRMWLEYFERAKIIGLDVSDFSWFEDDRFSFLRCDMSERALIAEATADIETPDIIIDDASHASSHQQNAFLELFPRLAPGGIYIIEDLRWQPEVYESRTPGITKTAALFESFIQDRVFSHSDPEIAAEFNALRQDISGCFLHQANFDKRRKDQVAVIHKL